MNFIFRNRTNFGTSQNGIEDKKKWDGGSTTKVRPFCSGILD